MSVKKRLGVCGMCKKVEAKYTCPGCQLSTCSLLCVKEHKVANDCDGILVKTVYRPLSHLGDEELQEDCDLFNDIHDFLSKRKRNLKNTGSRSQVQLPHHLHVLEKAIFNRGTRILFVPRNFYRHRTNTTYFNWQSQEVSWRIQFTFLNADHFQVFEERCPENTILETLFLEKFFDQSNPNYRNIKCYKKAGIDSIDILLKSEKITNSSNKFYLLNPKESIKMNLVGKTIIEFPQLYVLIKGFYSSSEPPPPIPRHKQQVKPKKKPKMESLLFPNTSLLDTNTNTIISSSSDEDEEDIF